MGQGMANRMPYMRVAGGRRDVEQVVAGWAARRLGGLDHERRVLALADRLFEVTRHLHGLGEGERRTLRLAALLHDVGRAEADDKRHAARGAALLRADTALPLRPGRRRRVAWLTAHHRGPLPEADNAPATLLALLRAADGLDARHGGTAAVGAAGAAVGVSLLGRLLIVRDVEPRRLSKGRRKLGPLLDRLGLDARLTPAARRPRLAA